MANDNKDTPKEYLEIGAVPGNFKVFGEVSYKNALECLNNAFDQFWAFYGFMRARDHRTATEDGKYINPCSSYILAHDMLQFLIENFAQMAYVAQHNFNFDLDLKERFCEHIDKNDKEMMKSRDKAYKDQPMHDELEKMKSDVMMALKRAVTSVNADTKKGGAPDWSREMTAEILKDLQANKGKDNDSTITEPESET